jgi:phytanoyl-CoA hydroxylase
MDKPYQNSVLTHDKPWFMASEISKDELNELPDNIRQHVRDVIENGYTVIKSALSKDFCSKIVEDFRAFANNNQSKFERFKDQDGHYPRIANLHAAFTPLREVFSRNQLALTVQRALFRSEPALYTSLFYERGSSQDIHRDTPYFSTKPEHFYLGVWVALEDADQNNGALEVVPKGHLIPEFDREAIALELFPNLESVPSASQQLWDNYQSKLWEACRERGLEKSIVPVTAGDTIIWHPQLPHGGSHIHDLSRTRFSFVMHTTPVGVPVYHQDVFFNPNKSVPLDSSRGYAQFDGAMFVSHYEVDFAHREQFDAATFVPVQ